MGPGPEGGIDLGSGVYMRWLAFRPDRALNPHLAHLPDSDRTGIIVGHVHPEEEGCQRHRGHVPEGCTANPSWCSSICEGAVLFDTPENQPRPGYAAPNVWRVESLDPLTISPSILMNPDKGGCGLHGFIREGRWVGV